MAIARKLGAKIYTGRGKHSRAVVVHEGKEIAVFGIRRGSQRNLGHDHVPKEIHFSPRRSRLLADCSLEREDWIRELGQKGIIASS
jgi:hypothetical protein